jgi:2,3-bisphosphoglycerate-dependent phosphoglycerate mutase
MKHVYLIRHAQSRYDPAIPESERPLTPLGAEQAQTLAALLASFGIEEIHTSPYRRCLETVRPFAQAAALVLNEVHDLRERLFSHGPIEDWAGVWRRAWMDFDFALADGESSRAAQARMHAATLALVKASSARTLAISSHGNTISLLLHRIDRRFTYEKACALRNPDVLRLTFDGTALRWDAAFDLAALQSFATHFESPLANRGAPPSQAPASPAAPTLPARS